MTTAAAPIRAGAHEPPWTAAALVERAGEVVVGEAETGTVPFPAGAVPTGATAVVPLDIGYGAVEEVATLSVDEGEAEAEDVAPEVVERTGTLVEVTVAVEAGRLAVSVTPALKHNAWATLRVAAVSAALHAASTCWVTCWMKALFAQIQAMFPAVQPGTEAVARPVTMF